jgi:hypothetical protein
MSDFYIDAGITRSQIANALSDKEEQAMWVLGELATLTDAERLSHYTDEVEDKDALLTWLDKLADAVRHDVENGQ